MALLAYNLTGAPVVLAAGSPARTIPASASPPNRGAPVDVTSELRPNLVVDPTRGIATGLNAAAYVALQAQGASVVFEWTDDPQYLTGALVAGGPSPGAHASTHIRGAADEVDGDLVDVDFVPTTYTRTVTAPATNAEHMTSHLAGLDGELADVWSRQGAAPPPEISALRVTGGTLSADGSENFSLLGTNFVQGQSFASITLGASLVITAEEPGVGGNALEVQVVDTGGAGPSTVAYAAGVLTIDLVGLTPNENAIAALINVAAAAWTGILRAHSGGGPAFGVFAQAPLTGGLGSGTKVYAGANGLCGLVGQAGGGATSDASASVQDTIIQVNPPALTGLTPALQAADSVPVCVVSNGKSSKTVNVVLA